MSWLFEVSIVTFTIFIVFMIAEKRYRKQFLHWRENNKISFIGFHIIIFSIAFNLPVLAIADYGNFVGSEVHLGCIILSISSGFSVGLDYMRIEKSDIPTDPVEHELWWINRLVKVSKNPSEKLERLIRRLIKSGKLTQEEVLEVLDKFTDREDSIGETATRLRLEVASDM